MNAKNNRIENNERKLDPELRRWVLKNLPGERTIVIRISYSKDPEEAAKFFAEIGMVVQSQGPNVVVAYAHSESIIQAVRLTWVVKIDLPQRQDMKSMFGNT